MFFVKQGVSHVGCCFEKDTIALNERAIINCTIDNTRCDKNVKEVRVKVLRQMMCTADSDSGRYVDSTHLQVSTYPGVRHGVKEEKKFEIDMSGLVDPYRRLKRRYNKKKRDLNPEDIAMQNQVVPTTSSSLINVRYFIEVYLIHKGMTFKSRVPPAVFEIKIHPASVNAVSAIMSG
jgi:hypothetical protein